MSIETNFFFNRTWIRYSNSTNQKRRKLGEFSFFLRRKGKSSLYKFISPKDTTLTRYFISHTYIVLSKSIHDAWKKNMKNTFFSIINIFIILILIHNYHVFIFIGNNIKILEETNGSLNSVCYPYWTNFWDIIRRLGVVIKWLWSEASI